MEEGEAEAGLQVGGEEEAGEEVEAPACSRFKVCTLTHTHTPAEKSTKKYFTLQN